MTNTSTMVDDHPCLTFSVKRGLEDLDDNFMVLEADIGKND